MWSEERNTDKRGRPFAVIPMRRRTRCWRRPKSRLVLFCIALDSGPLLFLAFLAADRLGRVLDALALVGLGLAHGAQFRRHLAHALPVGARDQDRGRLLAGDLDVVGDREVDLVAEAELQVE